MARLEHTMHKQLGLLGLIFSLSAAAQNQPAGNDIEVDLGCTVRYLDHSPPLSGRKLSVQLALADDCDVVWPAGQQMIPLRGQATAKVRAIRAERQAPSAGVLVIEFSELTRFNVRDGTSDSSVIIERQAVEITAAAAVPQPSEPVTPEQPSGNSGLVSAASQQLLLEQARQQMLDGNYERSIQIYTHLLEQPDGGHHATALEFLGVAYEKKGQLTQAVSSYRQHLAQFPDTGTDRVQQRLSSLLVGASAAREEPITAGRRWRSYGGVSQEYRHYSIQPDADVGETDTQSSLMTYADLMVAREGTRFDSRVRLNLGYQRDWQDDTRSPEDQGLVSNAYLEILDQELDWNARIGRQSLYSDGVLGRFDGAHASYRWRPNLSVRVTTGMPVDTPRYYANSSRPFVSASLNVEELADIFDISLFTVVQRNDGIADREAVGGELMARFDRWFALAQIDYDYSYDVVNSAYLQTGIRLSDRLQINARVHQYAYPFLTTQNALIGQPVSSINDLLDGYSEGQVRYLARNRTADAFTGTLGISATLSDRWQFNGDFNYTNIDGTPSTAGVAARPDTGHQVYYSANLIGSSVIRPSDTAILGFRLASNERTDTGTLLIDLRLPLGSSLRMGPRIAVSLREEGSAGDQTLVVEPSLRLIYRWRKRYRLELEGGGFWSSRDLPQAVQSQLAYTQDDERSNAYFFNLRWGVDF